MDNLKLYNQLREVPEDAKSIIQGGRMNGKTNIDPMWRIKKLTETFGVVGFGWKTKKTREWVEESKNGEKAVFINLELYVKIDGEWSEPIEGSGGNKLVELNKNGFYTNDEAYKMSYTDALGVCCKSLGMAADIYYGKDENKYTNTDNSHITVNQNSKPPKLLNEITLKRVKNVLYLMASKNQNRALVLLETHTTFTNEDGKIIKGCKKYEDLTQIRLEILDKKLKSLYPSLYQQVLDKSNKKDEKAV